MCQWFYLLNSVVKFPFKLLYDFPVKSTSRWGSAKRTRWFVKEILLSLFSEESSLRNHLKLNISWLLTWPPNSNISHMKIHILASFSLILTIQKFKYQNRRICRKWQASLNMNSWDNILGRKFLPRMWDGILSFLIYFSSKPWDTLIFCLGDSLMLIVYQGFQK